MINKLEKLKEAPLKVFFEELGYDVDWDINKLGPWLEIYEKCPKRLILQIDITVTPEMMKNEWVPLKEGDHPPFFIASELPEDEWEKLTDKIVDKLNKEF